jgi:uncharacterized RDD family membrane protein YckC
MSKYFNSLKSDLPAALVVFLVAVPLCLGIALDSGVPPISGLIAGLAGGIVVGLISNSHLSVSAPAAGLIATVAVIVLDAKKYFLTHGLTELEASSSALGLLFLSVVLAALSQHHLGILNKWLRNIKDVYRLHHDEIILAGDEDAQLRRLVELNVQEQVMNLSKTSIIQRAWKYEQRPVIHGWVYGLEDGILKEIFKMDHNAEIEDIYRYSDL